MATVNLGDKVKDSVSGFEGVAVAKSIYLNGCSRIGVQPRVDKDGKLVEAQWFDEPQLTMTGKIKVPMANRTVGGPVPYVPRRAKDPSR